MEIVEKDLVKICEGVLEKLSIMGYERKGGSSVEQLIFPNKFPSKKKSEEISEMDKEDSEKELLKYIRISEQELRQLFIEKFKTKRLDLFYSIETPTKEKYRFSKADKKVDDKINDIIKVYDNGQSALLDLCVFNNVDENYSRILNIEFKHGNVSVEAIAKDVLKLMHEEQNGAFIFLLKNTRSDTLCNSGKTGVLDKISHSFEAFKKDENNWKGNKNVQLIILSLEQKSGNNKTPLLIHRTVTSEDNLDEVFFVNDGCGDITTVGGRNGWESSPKK